MVERRLINAISVGSYALKILKDGAIGEVHSTFERAFNVLISGELVGITRRDVPNGPFNIITDIEPRDSMRSIVDKGERIRINGDLLSFEKGLKISLDGAEIWRPMQGIKNPIDIELVKRNLSLVKEIASRRNDGFGQLVRQIENMVSGKQFNDSQLNQVSRLGLPHIKSLVSAVRSEDLELVRLSAKSLVGLGPGLSPSGDDLLAGFMAGLRWTVNSFNGNADHVDEINRTIVHVAECTTMLGEQFLTRAADGEVNEAVEGLLVAILAGKIEEVRTATEKVLAIGETSGVDSIVGILLSSLLGIESLNSFAHGKKGANKFHNI
jgi:hypothetical protein